MFANNCKHTIIQLLTTEAVQPTSTMKNSKKRIRITFPHLLCIFSFWIMVLIPSNIYEICAPEIANRWDKLLFLKFSCISSDNSVFSPINKPVHKFAASCGKISFILFMTSLLIWWTILSTIDAFSLPITSIFSISTVIIPTIFFVFKYCW